MASLDINGITYVHSIKYFSKGIDQGGPFYNVEYQIEDWNDSDAFCNALKGVGGTLVGTHTSFTEPHRHHLSPNLICVAAEAFGRGRPTVDNSPTGPGLPAYSDGAIIRARYEAAVNAGNSGGGGIMSPADDPGFLHQVDPEQPVLWCTQQMRAWVEVLTMDNHKYKFQSTGKTFPSPVQFRFPHATYDLTFHQIPYLPKKLLRAALGRIHYVVGSPTTRFLDEEPETILFDSYDTLREANSAGSVVQKVHLVFQARSYSWNKALRPDRMPGDTDAYDYIVSDLGGYPFGFYDMRRLVQL